MIRACQLKPLHYPFSIYPKKPIDPPSAGNTQLNSLSPIQFSPEWTRRMWRSQHKILQLLFGITIKS